MVWGGIERGIGRAAYISRHTVLRRLLMNVDFLRSELDKSVRFDDDGWNLFISFIEPLHLKKKQYLFREGDIVTHLAFIQQGCVRYYLMDQKGDEHIVYFGFEGWWVGDMNSFFGMTPTIYHLQALEDTQLYAFNRVNFLRAIEETAYGQFFRDISSKSYMAIQRRYAEANTKTAEERYNDLCAKYPQVLQRVPQHYIASYLGIKPESLSRIRKNLLADGKK